MMLRMVPAVVLALAVLLIGVSAFARPPENADPAFAPWFQSLTDPTTGGGCCSQADCRPVEYRVAAGHYEVLIGPQFGSDVTPHWETVDPAHVLQKTDNPNRPPDRLLAALHHATGAVLRAAGGKLTPFTPGAAPPSSS